MLLPIDFFTPLILPTFSFIILSILLVPTIPSKLTISTALIFLPLLPYIHLGFPCRHQRWGKYSFMRASCILTVRFILFTKTFQCISSFFTHFPIHCKIFSLNYSYQNNQDNHRLHCTDLQRIVMLGNHNCCISIYNIIYFI